MSLIPSMNPSFRRRLAYGLASFVVLFLIGLGVTAKNGWLRSEPGAVATASSSAAAPPPPVQLSKEYIHAGSRLVAVEDANAGSSPTPTPAPGFEGDVAPRPNGTGALPTPYGANDYQQELKFFDGSATPVPGNEFQRADAAPEGTLGDGCLLADDVAQVTNYVTAQDPIRPTGGPTSLAPVCPPPPPGAIIGEDGKSAMAAESATSVPGLEREVRVATAIGRRGQTVTLPVLMNLRVGEVATVFTLEYDAARLSNPRVSLGTNLHPTTVLIVNTREPGKIGLVVATEAASFVTLPVELPLVFITFDVRSTSAIGSTAVNLTSSIAIQSVADRSASLVPTRYTNGSISVTN